MKKSEALRELARLIENSPECLGIQFNPPPEMSACCEPQPGVTVHARLTLDEMVLGACLAADIAEDLYD
jgi:hypothetical protein